MARKIIKQTSSFGVLRANPRISGNVKITVDSSKGICLNSIDSNSEMSNSAYKGFSISPDSSFDKDLYITGIIKRASATISELKEGRRVQRYS